MVASKENRAEAKKQKKIFWPRKFEGIPNYDASDWGRMLKNDRMKDPLDRKGGKLSRRRFRVPYPVYIKLVEMTRAEGWFSENHNCAGRLAAPLGLKVLAILRVLGRGYCFDGVEELCLISGQNLRVFFHRFCAMFSRDKFEEYCSHPTAESDIKRSMKVYTELGLPAQYRLLAYSLGKMPFRS